MKIIVYRDILGSIIGHWRPSGQETDKELENIVNRFNDTHTNSFACLDEISEGTLEAYLMEKLDRSYRLDVIKTAKDAIQNAEKALEEASFCIDSLNLGTCV